MEFKLEIFQALRCLENDLRYGKVWKNLENCEADLEKFGFHYTVDYCNICFVTLFAFHESVELSSFKISSNVWCLEIYNEVFLHRLPTPFAVLRNSYVL